jgi:hypothetical protein
MIFLGWAFHPGRIASIGMPLKKENFRPVKSLPALMFFNP